MKTHHHRRAAVVGALTLALLLPAPAALAASRAAAPVVDSVTSTDTNAPANAPANDVAAQPDGNTADPEAPADSASPTPAAPDPAPAPPSTPSSLEPSPAPKPPAPAPPVASDWVSAKAPRSKYIVTVKEGTTTVATQLRAAASSGAKVLVQVKKGVKVAPLGPTSSGFVSVKLGTKTGWIASKHLSIKNVVKDQSQRYLNLFASIRTAALPTAPVIGGVNFRSRVSLLKVSGSWSHIKTGYFHGWVPSSQLQVKIPAKQFRYGTRTGLVYSAMVGGKVTGKIGSGTRVDWRRSDASAKRDQVRLGGKWVWASGLSRAATSPPTTAVRSYGRFAKGAQKLLKEPVASASKVLTVMDGGKVTVTGKAGAYVRVSHAGKSGYLLASKLTASGTNSFGVYGTLRTGQPAAKQMKGYASKAMLKTPGSDLYQLWRQDWTFLTSGSRAVITEQFVYSRPVASKLKVALDEFEGMRYQGKRMYQRALLPLSDGSTSYVYRTSDWGTKVAKSSGRLIKATDFLKRS